MANENEVEDRSSTKRSGQFTFVLLTIVSTAAIACGLAGIGHCDFVRREVTLTPGLTAQSVCTRYNLTDQCEVLTNDQGVGLYSWYGVIPIDQPVCFSYTQWVQGVGYVTPDVGTRVKATRGFAIVASFFGLLAFFTLVISSCCPFVPGRIMGLPIYFFFATLFQGLTLLIFKSNVCQLGFFGPYFSGYPSITDSVQSVNCSLSKGANLCIAATVLYFVAMILSPAAVPLPPLGMKDEDLEYQRDQMAEQPREVKGEQEEP